MQIERFLLRLGHCLSLSRLGRRIFLCRHLTSQSTEWVTLSVSLTPSSHHASFPLRPCGDPERSPSQSPNQIVPLGFASLGLDFSGGGGSNASGGEGGGGGDLDGLGEVEEVAARAEAPKKVLILITGGSHRASGEAIKAAFTQELVTTTSFIYGDGIRAGDDGGRQIAENGVFPGNVADHGVRVRLEEDVLEPFFLRLDGGNITLGYDEQLPRTKHVVEHRRPVVVGDLNSGTASDGVHDVVGVVPERQKDGALHIYNYMQIQAIISDRNERTSISICLQIISYLI